MKLLLVIDVQNGFINENTKDTVLKINNLVNQNRYKHIIFTRYINDENSIFYKKLGYKGCINKEEQRIPIDTKNHTIIDKEIYSAFSRELENYIKENNITEIHLCGFDTDACVLKTALDLFENNYDVYILKDYCMCSKGIELHNFIINNLKRLIGKDKII